MIDYMLFSVKFELFSNILTQKYMAQKADRDIEKSYSKSEFVAKLRRLADAIENDERFEIQIANERIYVPKRAIYNIEHEREDGEEEIEFQIKWSQED